MNMKFKKFILLQFSVLLTLVFISSMIKAEPNLAYKNNMKCVACHVNPNGGGQRNTFGRTYGQMVLPSKANPFDINKLAQLTQYLSIGSDTRFNANYQRDNNKQASKSFEVGSTLLYANIVFADTGLSFYIDEQIAPGTAVNREAWAMMAFESGNFLKVGKMFLPYGLRIEDDGAFIRQVTGMNFDNGDNGVEYTINYDKSAINFFMANGTSQTTNDDDKFLYGIRAEHLFSNYRIGTTMLLNDNEQQSKMFNIYSGVSWRDITLLAEVDFITFDSEGSNRLGEVKQLISLIELNFQWQQGVNFKITAEYFDPNKDIDENEQTRYSFVAEYTPFSNVQLRFGVRSKEDIPQKPAQSYEAFFAQSHFYF